VCFQDPVKSLAANWHRNSESQPFHLTAYTEISVFQTGRVNQLAPKPGSELWQRQRTASAVSSWAEPSRSLNALGPAAQHDSAGFTAHWLMWLGFFVLCSASGLLSPLHRSGGCSSCV